MEKCEFCGKVFYKNNPNKRFCCYSCRRRAEGKRYKLKHPYQREKYLRKKENRECITCKKIFLGRKNQKYCSLKCNHQFQYNKKNPIVLMKTICPFCKKEFETRYKRKKYCSQRCCLDNWRTVNIEHFNELIRNAPSTKRRVQWEKEHREIMNAKQREYRKKNRERLRIRENKWNKNNREKVNAKRKAQYNIKIPNGQLCEVCNERLAVNRHHPDYTQPLLVKFLCKRCHNKIHKKIKYPKLITQGF